MSYKNTVCFSPASLDGCGMWRMFMPHLNVEESGFVFNQSGVMMDAISVHDVIAVQRFMTEHQRKVLEMCRAYGLRIVYDLDDNLWKLPSTNSAKMTFEKYKTGLSICASYADVITVSTPMLKRAMVTELEETRNIQTNKQIPIEVIKNYIDLNMFHECKLPKNEDEVVIGWAGSNTHSGDVGEVWDVLPYIHDKYPQTRFEFVGENPPKAIAKSPRVKVRNWVHIAEYAQTLALWGWDIFLAPLDTNKFNRCKSNIKMLEAGALKKPCLASFIENYKDFAESAVTPNSLDYLLCASQYQWENRLEHLIESKQAREDYGNAAYETVKENWNMRKEGWRWQNVVDMALS